MWLDTEIDIRLEDLHDDVEYGVLGAYYFTDSGQGRIAFDVPHLTNIYNGAPYLHNGAARTLEEIWTVHNMIDLHGLTRDLTRGQMNDLIEYLKSL